MTGKSGKIDLTQNPVKVAYSDYSNVIKPLVSDMDCFGSFVSDFEKGVVYFSMQRNHGYLQCSTKQLKEEGTWRYDPKTKVLTKIIDGEGSLLIY
jgi:hypothetical protein